MALRTPSLVNRHLHDRLLRMNDRDLLPTLDQESAVRTVVVAAELIEEPLFLPDAISFTERAGHGFAPLRDW